MTKSFSSLICAHIVNVLLLMIVKNHAVTAFQTPSHCGCSSFLTRHPNNNNINHRTAIINPITLRGWASQLFASHEAEHQENFKFLEQDEYAAKEKKKKIFIDHIDKTSNNNEMVFGRPSRMLTAMNENEKEGTKSEFLALNPGHLIMGVVLMIKFGLVMMLKLASDLVVYPLLFAWRASVDLKQKIQQS